MQIKIFYKYRVHAKFQRLSTKQQRKKQAKQNVKYLIHNFVNIGVNDIFI